MNIISRLIENNIIRTHQNNYYLDLNNNGYPESSELIKDLNDNDQVETPEILNFILNYQRSLPRINQVSDTLEQLSSEYAQDFKLAVTARQDFERVYELYKNALNRNISADITRFRTELKQLGIKAAAYGYHPFADFNKYYLPEIGLVEAITDISQNSNGTLKRIELNKPKTITLPDGGSGAVIGLEFRQDMNISRIIFETDHIITLFNSGRINRISAKEIFYNENKTIMQIKVSEPQLLRLPDKTTALVTDIITFNSFGMISSVTLAEPHTISLARQASPIIVEGTLSFNNLGQPFGILTLLPDRDFEMILPGGTAARITDYIELSANNQLLTVNLAENGLIKTAAGDEIVASGQVSYNESAQLIGEVQLEGTAVVTSPAGNRFQAKDTLLFDDNGILKQLMLSNTRTINLLAGGRYQPVEITGLGFFPTGEIESVIFAAETAEIPVDFAENNISVTNKVVYNQAGKPIELILSENTEIRLPSSPADTAVIKDIEFYSGGEIKRVILDSTALVTLPTGQRVKVVEEISFSRQGTVTMVIPEESCQIILPDSQQTVTAINELYFHDNGSLYTVTPLSPLQYTIDPGLNIEAGVLIYSDDSKLRSVQLSSPLTYEAEGRSFNILSIDFDLQRKNVLYFHAAERARGIALDNDFYSVHLITITRSGRVLSIEARDF